MRRRAFLATAGTVALAGCTASGDGGEADPEDYDLRGFENSEVYHYGSVQAPSIFDIDFIFGGDDAGIILEFDPNAEYDPADHDVYLMDGERVVAEGYAGGVSGSGADLIEFDIDASALKEQPTYRVVSMEITHPADEFELEIVRKERDSDA